MSQVTIRDLSPEVEALLRERARFEGRSLSKVASELLTEASGFDADRRKRDLSRFFGTWSGEEVAAFETTQSSFGDIDRNLWE